MRWLSRELRTFRATTRRQRMAAALVGGLAGWAVAVLAVRLGWW